MSDTALMAYQLARQSQLIRNEARHIRSKVNDARGSRHDAGVRWPFELLQNAHDAGPRPGREDVEIWLRQDGHTFVFDHDGAFFSMRELAALLSGGSSKDFDGEDTTGRFGTGFLVTHVLASKTSVSGILTAEGGAEAFLLELDREGDEEAIVGNIQACDAAIRSAHPLASTDELPSASFKYIADDQASLARGLASFGASVPFLFATCEKLGRVNLTVTGAVTEHWEASAISSRVVDNSVVSERSLLCRTEEDVAEYRTIRVAATAQPTACAIAVLTRKGQGWQVLVPSDDYPRVFCRYPVRSSSFLPVNAILDAPFELDQERRRVLLDKDGVKALFHSAVSAVVPLVRLAFAEGWGDCHWLARAAVPLSSFSDSEDAAEVGWLTGEMQYLAQLLASLPLVETRDGPGVSVAGTDYGWFADFVMPDADRVSMARLWPLVDDAKNLYPPVAVLAEPWAKIATGWRELGIPVNEIGLAQLALDVRKDTEQISGLKVSCDPREWVARFIDVVGESWATRGVSADLLDGLIPSQLGTLVPRATLKRDGGIPSELKDIADEVGCDVRARLVDEGLLHIARDRSLEFVENALAAAVPVVMTEDDVLEESVRVFDKRFPKGDELSEANRALVLSSIRLLDFLAGKTTDNSALASRVPLLAADGTFARTSAQRKMMPPVSLWDERARPFCSAYPTDRVLAPEYCGTDVVSALVRWGIALPDIVVTMAPNDPIKGDRLRCLAVENENTEGVQISGEEFTQVALLHELIPRCQTTEDAAALLGLTLCYVASADEAWRETRAVTGRRAGADVSVMVRGALWLADLRGRAWVPVRSDEGTMIQAIPTPESLKDLLEPAWIRENKPALDLLGQFFGFDALDLQLLTAPDDISRQQVRDRLAHIVQLVGIDPMGLSAVATELEARQKRARDVARCRKFGLGVQAAIQQALERHHLAVNVVDCGYDFEVSYDDIDDAASLFEVGPYLVEVKATTHGEAKLTPKQAETASQRTDRFVLCVVDLRAVSEQRLDEPWTAADVLPLAHFLPSVGILVQGTWLLVEEARVGRVSLRNESALRYAVPPSVWETGCSISEWVDATFNHEVA